ncbi:helix-turn-helix domain-containing protein [Deinococcus hopiensis]|uniref:Leucine-zipper of insertion element IS481 n=1 Tax=Deinococcus hopiensis KR-140 TaxID=695939 RepID=A0A1W1VVF9_9DEIO|nr:helix-turn-helix domain-containing protein [Deinococcus hopiensis]SMB97091.1 leucine-zipper of insertion element IS481 [Deinococcus hopiensis KR-140]
MTDRHGSSEQDVEILTDERRAEVVTDREQLRLLAPFMGQERTVSQVAAHLGLSVTATYKAVARFVGLGLLRETRREARPGRALRYYRAPAAFFTPFSVRPLEQIGQHNRSAHLQRFERQFARTMRRDLHGPWGALTRALPSGETFYDLATVDGHSWNPLDDASPLVLSGWNLLTLPRAEARALQRELMAVVRPYLNRQAKGDTYLLGVFLTPDNGEH